MTKIMDRAFRSFLLTLGRLDEHEAMNVERAFKGGMLVMLSKVVACGSAAEFEALKLVILSESRQFMDLIPCTCGKCREREARSQKRGS